jgi:hypothetical protein
LEPQEKDRTFAKPRLDLDLCFVVGHRVANDRKAKPGPARLATSRLIDSVEPFENPINISSGNTDSMVSDPNEHFGISTINGHFDSGSGIGVLNGVVDEISNCRQKLSALTDDHCSRRRHVQLNRYARLGRRRSKSFNGICGNIVQIDSVATGSVD